MELKVNQPVQLKDGRVGFISGLKHTADGAVEKVCFTSPSRTPNDPTNQTNWMRYENFTSQLAQEVPTPTPGIQELLISRIKFDTKLQARVQMSNETIAEYMQALEDGAVFPPVVVFTENGLLYHLADGYHRVAAHLQTQRNHIKADVRLGTERDAMLHAIGANASHGLRRTNADKIRACEMLLLDEEWRQLADRSLAKYAAVDHKTIGKVRARMVQEGRISATEVRITADGISYTVPTQPAKRLPRFKRNDVLRANIKLNPSDPFLTPCFVKIMGTGELHDDGYEVIAYTSTRLTKDSSYHIQKLQITDDLKPVLLAEDSYDRLVFDLLHRREHSNVPSFIRFPEAVGFYYTTGAATGIEKSYTVQVEGSEEYHEFQCWTDKAVNLLIEALGGISVFNYTEPLSLRWKKWLSAAQSARIDDLIVTNPDVLDMLDKDTPPFKRLKYLYWQGIRVISLAFNKTEHGWQVQVEFSTGEKKWLPASELSEQMPSLPPVTEPQARPIPSPAARPAELLSYVSALQLAQITGDEPHWYDRYRAVEAAYTDRIVLMDSPIGYLAFGAHALFLRDNYFPPFAGVECGVYLVDGNVDQARSYILFNKEMLRRLPASGLILFKQLEFGQVVFRSRAIPDGQALPNQTSFIEQPTAAHLNEQGDPVSHWLDQDIVAGVQETIENLYSINEPEEDIIQALELLMVFRAALTDPAVRTAVFASDLL